MASAVEFEKERNALVLVYRPQDDDSWVQRKFSANESITVKGTFRLGRKNLILQEVDREEDGIDWTDEERLRFRLGRAVNDYYEIDDAILNVGHPVLIHNSCEPTWKWFVAGRRASIFKTIAELRPVRVVVGGPEDDAIPELAFRTLIERFPTDHELHRYSLARVASVVRDYMSTKVDAEKLYNAYVDRRIEPRKEDIVDEFRNDDIRKFRVVRELLARMLANEISYSEARWQALIIQIIRLLYPQYIQALERVSIRDVDAGKRREIDILLIAASGCVDILEIKKPFDKSVLSDATYRDNYIPLRELSGSVMQIEKYIYYLNRWGRAGEGALTAKYSSVLPKNFALKIASPRGMIIIGRENALTSAQLSDFEFVRRKYKSIVDIVTYDDLLRRLDFIVEQLSGPEPSNGGE